MGWTSSNCKFYGCGLTLITDTHSCERRLVYGTPRWIGIATFIALTTYMDGSVWMVQPPPRWLRPFGFHVRRSSGLPRRFFIIATRYLTFFCLSRTGNRAITMPANTNMLRSTLPPALDVRFTHNTHATLPGSTRRRTPYLYQPVHTTACPPACVWLYRLRGLDLLYWTDLHTFLRTRHAFYLCVLGYTACCRTAPRTGRDGCASTHALPRLHLLNLPFSLSPLLRGRVVGLLPPLTHTARSHLIPLCPHFMPIPLPLYPTTLPHTLQLL